MTSGPPRYLEVILEILLPPRRREELLGDLAERYVSPAQYARDVLTVLPAILWSQIRRTTGFEAALLEFCLLQLSFLLSAGTLDAEVVLRTFPAALAMQIGFVIALAFEVPVPGAAAFAVAWTMLIEGLLKLAAPEIAMNSWNLVIASSFGVLLLCGSRVFLRKGDPMPNQPDKAQTFQKEVFRANLRLVFTLTFPVFMIVMELMSGRPLDWVFGSAMLALVLFMLYQIRRRWVRARMAAQYGALVEQRRRDLLTIGWWYVGPFLATLILFAVRLPLTTPDPSSAWRNILPFTILSIVWALATILLARKAARKLDL